MWKQTLLLGSILGLLQILLVLGWGLLAQWSFSWLLFGLLSVLFYLAIPALGGFLASWQNQETDAVFPPGCIAFLVEGSAFLVMPAIVLTPLRPIVCPPGSCRGLSAGIGGVFFLTVTGAFFLLEALLVGPLGGWIGSNLGRRWAAASNRRSTTAEERAPQETDD